MRQICRDCKYYCIYCGMCSLERDFHTIDFSCSEWESDEESKESEVEE